MSEKDRYKYEVRKTVRVAIRSVDYLEKLEMLIKRYKRNPSFMGENDKILSRWKISRKEMVVYIGEEKVSELEMAASIDKRGVALSLNFLDEMGKGWYWFDEYVVYHLRGKVKEKSII